MDIAESKKTGGETGKTTGKSRDTRDAKGKQGIICNNIYRTKDGRYVSLAALEPKFWQNFCQAVSREDLLPYHRSPANGDNPAFQQMKDLFGQATLEEWQARLSPVDCCFAPVLTGTEALESEYVRSRDLKINLHHPTEGLLKQIAFPVKVLPTGVNLADLSADSTPGVDSPHSGIGSPEWRDPTPS